MHLIKVCDAFYYPHPFRYLSCPNFSFHDHGRAYLLNLINHQSSRPFGLIEVMITARPYVDRDDVVVVYASTTVVNVLCTLCLLAHISRSIFTGFYCSIVDTIQSGSLFLESHSPLISQPLRFGGSREQFCNYRYPAWHLANITIVNNTQKSKELRRRIVVRKPENMFLLSLISDDMTLGMSSFECNSPFCCDAICIYFLDCFDWYDLQLIIVCSCRSMGVIHREICPLNGTG